MSWLTGDSCFWLRRLVHLQELYTAPPPSSAVRLWFQTMSLAQDSLHLEIWQTPGGYTCETSPCCKISRHLFCLIFRIDSPSPSPHIPPPPTPTLNRHKVCVRTVVVSLFTHPPQVSYRSRCLIAPSLQPPRLCLVATSSSSKSSRLAAAVFGGKRYFADIS